MILLLQVRIVEKAGQNEGGAEPQPNFVSHYINLKIEK